MRDVSVALERLLYVRILARGYLGRLLGPQSADPLHFGRLKSSLNDAEEHQPINTVRWSSGMILA